MFGFWLSFWAALATFLGFFVFAWARKTSARVNAWSLIVAAVAMILVSVVELIPTAFGGVRDAWFFWLWFGLGAVGYSIVRTVARALTNGSTNLMRSAIIVTVALTLHNLPEGTASITAAFASQGVGVSTALAIAIQNVPEGLSITALVLAAGASKLRAFVFVAISVIAEISGAVIVQVNQDAITADLRDGLLLAVAGVMIAISVMDLLPDAHKLLAPGAAAKNRKS
jgi:ZIP family zinc transporter